MLGRPVRFGVFVLFFVASATGASSARGQKAESFAAGQIIIKFNTSVLPTDALMVQSALDATVKRRFRSTGAELWKIEGMAVPDAVRLFQSDPRVAYVEPDYVVHTNEVIPNDPRFGELWGLHNTGQAGGVADADIDAPEAWSIGTGGTVLVGVIDTGVDWHHADLAANIYTNPGETPANGIDDDSNGFVDDVHGWDFVNGDNDPYDDHGHGTHVSGTIAAVGNNGVGVVGVSWSARILPLKFLDADGYGWTSDAILAVEYATMMGVRLTSNSWGGGGFSSALRDAIEAAGNRGILFVAAAGNDAMDTDADPHYPSSYDLDNIISVASTDRIDARSGFSNYGLVSVDLGAPGSSILSTFPQNSYGSISGTSMATPHVSGAVSLVWAVDPTMTHLAVKDALLSTVDPLPALAGKVVSGGRLNVGNLLSALDDIAPAPVKNLALQTRGSSSIRLTWTASGDDSTVGTASVYDLRYSTARINPGNFDAATRASGTPHPAPVGSSESFEVTGLNFNTKYYFALVVEDEQRNRSPVSDFAKATTMGVPRLAFSPGSFAANLRTGGRETRTLTLSNTAAGTLDFSTPASPSWVSVNPPSGRVNAGKSLRLDVIFDATRLRGGAYDSTLTLATNDPTRRTVLLPLSLQVTDAADIAASPPAIDFGVHYTSLCATNNVVVTNIGTVALVVTSVGIGNPQFSTDTAPFSLDPGQSRTLAISFCPVSVGVINTALVMQSNDPDHPTHAVPLRGEGVGPPIIAVTPVSLSEDLHTGARATHTLTISNSGGSPLNFEIELEKVHSESVVASHASESDQRRRAHADTDRGSRSSVGATRVSVTPRAPAPVPGGDGTEEAVLVIQDYRAWNVDMGEFISQHFALSPTVINADQIEATDFANFDLVITTGDQGYYYYDAISSNVQKFEEFVAAGGVVQYQLATQGDNVSIAGGASVVFDRLEMFNEVVAPSHPIVAGLPAELEGNYANHTIIENLPASSTVITETSGSGDPTTVEYKFGRGSVIATGMTWEFLYYYGYQAGAMLENAVEYSLSLAGMSWLIAEPDAGTVEPGEAMQVAVTFDAGGLYGDDYLANLRIANNGLIDPEVVVPVALHVTGAPDIMLSETALDYGEQFVGAAVSRTLVVSNEGTDLLTVGGISSSHPNYTADVSSFTLAPFTKRNVIVTFRPTTPGTIAAALTITSNDFDEGVVTLPLAGVGVEPPIISVTPGSLSEDLVTGATATQTLTIANSGESNLSLSIAVEDIGGPFMRGNDVTRGLDESTVAASMLAASVPGVSQNTAPRVASSAHIDRAHRDTHSYPPMKRMSGGPDPFGYRWRDSNERSGPKFNWIDVSDGTDIPVWDDEFKSVPLGFTFTYYGEEFTAIDVCSNGWLSFVAHDPSDDFVWYPYDVPSVDYHAGAIAPYAYDLFVNGYVRYRVLGEAPRRQFVVEFNNMGTYYDDDYRTFEVIFTEGANTIRFQYLVVSNPPEGFGIESPDQLMGMGNAGVDDLFISPQLVRNSYAIEFTTLPVWLTAEPLDAVVAPHSSIDVAVTFNAAELYGGNYPANLRIMNNDPIHPEVAVPVSLHVTGAPDIALSESLMDYGPQFIGAAITRTLIVSNQGTDLLTVSGIVSSHANYAVDMSSFSLAPRASQNVVITFAPTATGPVMATLAIASNDFDEGVKEVELRGTGVEPPIISVTPTSLAEDLLTGETATHTLTISNTGQSPLEFAIGRQPLPAADEIQPSILVIQNADAWGVSMHDFIEDRFGTTPMVINSAQIDSTDFSRFDIIITTGNQDPYYYHAISANVGKFESFVRTGGIVQYQLATPEDDVTIVGGVKVVFGDHDLFNIAVTPTHPIVAGLPYWIRGAWNTNRGYITNLPAERIVITETYSEKNPTTVEYKFGMGTVIATGMEWERLYHDGGDAAPILGNAVAYSLSLASVLWLRAIPSVGTVQPGQSMNIAVGFDAAGLYGGDYRANLRILNNDPLRADVAVPVELHVTGAPDIAVTPLSLTFDPLFIGNTQSKTLVISNQGTALLTVSDVSSTRADFTVDTETFTLEPKASRNVLVTFAPASAGALPATLSVTSNDADESVVNVALQGAGVPPPVIAVTPTSLDVDLFSGEASTRTLTIDNTEGGSDLTWNAWVQPIPAAGTGQATLESGTAISWLEVVPAVGTVPAHGSAVVSANFNATGLYGGDYPASIVFASNAPRNSPVVIPGLLHVTGAPDISITPPGPLAYGSVFIGQTGSKIVTVSNVGTDLLTVSNVSFDHADYSADVTEFTLSPQATRDVLVSFMPTTPGPITGVVTISSDDPDEAALQVSLSGTGVEPPVITVAPLAVADTLAVGETATFTVSVANVGASNLEINVTPREESTPRASGPGAGDAVDERLVANVAKGQEDTRSYPPMTRGSGGPDPFGYRWRDSNDPAGPVFNWIDASSGTSLPLVDDDFVEGVPLGFTFVYYGIEYTTIGIGSNGWLSFNGSQMWFPGNVPLRDVYPGAIAPYARDLYPGGGNYVRYRTIGAAPTRQFIVEYNRVPVYQGQLNTTFEVIFTESRNSICFQYLVAPLPPAGFGIESPDQTMGMGNTGTGDLFISPALVSDNYAIEFSTLPVWLSVEPTTATIPPGESLELVATLDATRVRSATYAGALSIVSNDPITPFVSVQVSLVVDSTSSVAVAPPASPAQAHRIEIPTSYALHPNRPNPFNPSTTISYDLPSAENVRLVIYDVSGRKIREWQNHQPAGRHLLTWDGRNSSSEPVASGVYFYRLTAGRFVQTRKMVLLK